MPTFRIRTAEVWVRDVEIEAATPKGALQKYEAWNNGKLKIDPEPVQEFDFSHNLNSPTVVSKEE